MEESQRASSRSTEMQQKTSTLQEFQEAKRRELARLNIWLSSMPEKQCHTAEDLTSCLCGIHRRTRGRTKISSL